MVNEKKALLNQLKQLAKDGESYQKLKELIGDIYDRYELAKTQIELLEHAIRNDYDSIVITELNLEKPGPRIVYVNEEFTRMTGYSKEEIVGKTPRILQGPKTDRAMLKRLKQRLEEGQAFFGHTINYRKDGSEFINQWDVHPLINNQGEVTHWVSYQRDISEKKETAKAFFTSRLSNLLNRREEFTVKFVKERGGIRVKLLTEAFEEITGCNKEVVFKSGLEEVLHANDREKVNKAIEEAFNGKCGTEKCRYKTSCGNYVSTLQSFKPITDATGSKVKSVKSVVKIELKQS